MIGGLIGSLITLSHPFSAIAGAASAPFTTLHPLLAAGWFSGIVEAYLRKPTVKDFEDFPEDMDSLAGWFKNRVARVFLVIAGTNIGVGIGIGAWLMVRG